MIGNRAPDVSAQVVCGAPDRPTTASKCSRDAGAGRLADGAGFAAPGSGPLNGRTEDSARRPGVDAARADADVKGARPETLHTKSWCAAPDQPSRATTRPSLAIVLGLRWAAPLAWNGDRRQALGHAAVSPTSSTPGTGKVLRRENTVDFATGLAWDYFPGPLPSNNSGVATSRDFTAKGWLASNATTLNWQQRPHLLRPLSTTTPPPPGDEVPPLERQQLELLALALQRRQLSSSTARINFPCSWDSGTANSWQSNMKQNATQLFYFVNQFHDYLKASPIGFTEAAGNFQVTNSSGQGAGGDAVQAQALDGANTASGFPDANHFNTADMGTRADGTPPRMQMYLTPGSAATAVTSTPVTTPRSSTTSTRTASRPAGHRLDGNPALGAQQSGSMGEGWSDWYAMDYLVSHGSTPTTPRWATSTANYYVAGGPGARTEPLDCPVTDTDDRHNSTARPTAATRMRTSARSPARPRFTPTARSGPRRCGSSARSWSRSTARGRRQRVRLRHPRHGARVAEPVDGRRAQRDPPGGAATATGGPYAGRTTTTCCGTRSRTAAWATTPARSTATTSARSRASPSRPPPARRAGRSAGRSRRPTVERPPVRCTSSSAATTVRSRARRARTASTRSPTCPRHLPVRLSGRAGVRDDRAKRHRQWRDDAQLHDPPQLGAGRRRRHGERVHRARPVGQGSDRPKRSTAPRPRAGGARRRPARRGRAARSRDDRLPRAITLSQFAVDPGATCGDDDNASLGGYKIETSPNGSTFTRPTPERSRRRTTTSSTR